MLPRIASPYWQLATLGVFSRIFTLTIGKLASFYFQRFDKSTSLSQTNSFFLFLESWDAVHFGEISKNGYTREHLLPFFPLLPLICRTITIFNPFVSGMLINSVLLVLSSLVLYKISLLFFSKKVSFISALYFIFNPASIIYSSMYSESLFTFLFLLALWYTIHKKYFISGLLLGLSALCRSNGSVFILFMETTYFPLLLIPLCYFQLYCLGLIWKSACTTRLFFPYSYIQKKYWNQGFLKFLNTCNTPNILIGAPVILLCLFFAFKSFSIFFGKNKKISNQVPNEVKSGMKMMSEIQGKRLFMRIFSFSFWKNFISDPFFCKHDLILEKLIFILILQTFLLIFCIHWNIAMRFITFNPIFYWIAAHLTLIYSNHKYFKSIFTFFMVYGILYVITFSCFYPPA